LVLEPTSPAAALERLLVRRASASRRPTLLTAGASYRRRFFLAAWWRLAVSGSLAVGLAAAGLVRRVVWGSRLAMFIAPTGRAPPAPRTAGAAPTRFHCAAPSWRQLARAELTALRRAHFARRDVHAHEPALLLARRG